MNKLYQNDIPADINWGNIIAVDTETMGLNNHRDRLCVVQLSSGDGNAHLVQLNNNYDCPNLKALLADNSVTKIFHYARFDVAVMYKYLDILVQPIYCTKIASKLTRTFTDKHGLKNNLRDVLGIEVSKEQQSSDWGAAELNNKQVEYAANDVLYLHKLKEHFDNVLQREGRTEFANKCFEFIPTLAQLDLQGWDEEIFSHR